MGKGPMTSRMHELLRQKKVHAFSFTYIGFAGFFKGPITQKQLRRMLPKFIFLVWDFPICMFYELPREGVSSIIFQTFLIKSLEYFILKYQILSPLTQNLKTTNKRIPCICILEEVSLSYNILDFSE